MPGFAHWFFAIGLAIFLWKVTEGKFGIKPAFVFIVNNAYGPDIASLFFEYDDPWYYFFHGMGWYLMAFLVAIIWFYVMNGRLDLKQPGKNYLKFKLIDQSERLKYWQIYLFCAAGGMFHHFIDIIGHPAYIHSGNLGTNVPWGVIWFGGNNYFSIDFILSTGLFPCGNMFPAVVAITIGYAIGFVLSFLWGVRTKNFMNFAKGMLLVVGAVFAIQLITYYIPVPGAQEYFLARFYNDFTYYGDPEAIPALIWVTGGEADFGVTIYLSVFFFAPLIELWLGFKDLPPTVPRTASTPEVTPGKTQVDKEAAYLD